MKYNQEEVVSIVYTNYRGETSERKIVPQKLWFGSTGYHKEKQWLLDVFDVEKVLKEPLRLKISLTGNKEKDPYGSFSSN